VVTSARAGYYFFQCTIPDIYQGRKSGIVTYVVTENVGEN
jgi:hypothetical protein